MNWVKSRSKESNLKKRQREFFARQRELAAEESRVGPLASRLSNARGVSYDILNMHVNPHRNAAVPTMHRICHVDLDKFSSKSSYQRSQSHYVSLGPDSPLTGAMENSRDFGSESRRKLQNRLASSSTATVANCGFPNQFRQESTFSNWHHDVESEDPFGSKRDELACPAKVNSSKEERDKIRTSIGTETTRSNLFETCGDDRKCSSTSKEANSSDKSNLTKVDVSSHNRNERKRAREFHFPEDFQPSSSKTLHSREQPPSRPFASSRVSTLPSDRFESKMNDPILGGKLVKQNMECPNSMKSSMLPSRTENNIEQMHGKKSGLAESGRFDQIKLNSQRSPPATGAVLASFKSTAPPTFGTSKPDQLCAEMGESSLFPRSSRERRDVSKHLCEKAKCHVGTGIDHVTSNTDRYEQELCRHDNVTHSWVSLRGSSEPRHPRCIDMGTFSSRFEFERHLQKQNATEQKVTSWLPELDVEESPTPVCSSVRPEERRPPSNSDVQSICEDVGNGLRAEKSRYSELKLSSSSENSVQPNRVLSCCDGSPGIKHQHDTFGNVPNQQTPQSIVRDDVGDSRSQRSSAVVRSGLTTPYLGYGLEVATTCQQRRNSTIVSNEENSGLANNTVSTPSSARSRQDQFDKEIQLSTICSNSSNWLDFVSGKYQQRFMTDSQSVQTKPTKRRNIDVDVRKQGTDYSPNGLPSSETNASVSSTKDDARCSSPAQSLSSDTATRDRCYQPEIGSADDLVALCVGVSRGNSSDECPAAVTAERCCSEIAHQCNNEPTPTQNAFDEKLHHQLRQHTAPSNDVTKFEQKDSGLRSVSSSTASDVQQMTPRMTFDDVLISGNVERSSSSGHVGTMVDAQTSPIVCVSTKNASTSPLHVITKDTQTSPVITPAVGCDQTRVSRLQLLESPSVSVNWCRHDDTTSSCDREETVYHDALREDKFAENCDYQFLIDIKQEEILTEPNPAVRVPLPVVLDVYSIAEGLPCGQLQSSVEGDQQAFLSANGVVRLVTLVGERKPAVERTCLLSAVDSDHEQDVQDHLRTSCCSDQYVKVEAITYEGESEGDGETSATVGPDVGCHETVIKLEDVELMEAAVVIKTEPLCIDFEPPGPASIDAFVTTD